MANKKNEILTIADYIELAGITASAISYRIKNNLTLPGILKAEYHIKERCYFLTRDESIKDKDIKNYFRQQKAIL